MPTDIFPSSLPVPSSIPLQAARVTRLIRETPSTVTIEFATDTPLAYRPGQYVHVEFRLGRGRFRRAYSLSSVPGDARPAITVKYLPGGKISEHCTRRLAVGDEFRVSAAEGQFLLPDSRAGRHFVFIAGGAGITPVFSLLRTLLAMPQPPAVTLLYYSRHAHDIIFHAALQQLAAQHAAFDLRIYVTAPGESADAPPVLSVPHLQTVMRDPATASLYVCGPESLMTTALQNCTQAGVDPARIFVEHFASPPTRARSDLPHRAVFLARGLLWPRRIQVRGRPGESLLDMAERAGLKTRSRCRNGSCGSCRATLLRGEVEMDEPNSLTAADARANRILACVSHPQSPVIVDLRH